KVWAGFKHDAVILNSHAVCLDGAIRGVICFARPNVKRSPVVRTENFVVLYMSIQKWPTCVSAVISKSIENAIYLNNDDRFRPNVKELHDAVCKSIYRANVNVFHQSVTSH